MGAMTFDSIGTNSLILLTSSKVHPFTRICAAFFGISIIGSGVPVLCVIIRTAIHHTKLCSYSTSLFLGSVMPYLVCWTLYQGSTLSLLLSWTGLIVNGSVAFLFPLILVLRALELQRRAAKREHLGGGFENFPDQEASTSNPSEISPLQSTRSSRGFQWLGDNKHSNRVVDVGQDGGIIELTDRRHRSNTDEQSLLGKSPCPPGIRSDQFSEAGRITALDNTSLPLESIRKSSSNDDGLEDPKTHDKRVNPLPSFLEPYRKHIVVTMILVFAAIMIATIVNDLFMAHSENTSQSSVVSSDANQESISLATALRRQYRQQQQQLMQQRQEQLQQEHN